MATRTDGGRGVTRPGISGLVAVPLIGLTIVWAAVAFGWQIGDGRPRIVAAVDSGGKPAAHALPAASIPSWPALHVQMNPELESALDRLTAEALDLLPPEQAAKLHMNTIFKQLEQSGAASAALISDALKAVEGLKRLPELTNAELSGFRCFGDGCVVTATSKDVGSAAAVADALAHSEQFLRWPGPKFRSGPLRSPSGQVQAVVVLYRTPSS